MSNIKEVAVLWGTFQSVDLSWMSSRSLDKMSFHMLVKKQINANQMQKHTLCAQTLQHFSSSVVGVFATVVPLCSYTLTFCFCFRDRSPVVPGCSVLRAVLCNLPTSGEHPTASQACSPGSAVCLDLLLHLDLPSSAGLEQIHCKQDRNHL